jgi:hypothetical protein
LILRLVLARGDTSATLFYAAKAKSYWKSSYQTAPDVDHNCGVAIMAALGKDGTTSQETVLTVYVSYSKDSEANCPSSKPQSSENWKMP